MADVGGEEVYPPGDAGSVESFAHEWPPGWAEALKAPVDPDGLIAGLPPVESPVQRFAVVEPESTPPADAVRVTGNVDGREVTVDITPGPLADALKDVGPLSVGPGCYYTAPSTQERLDDVLAGRVEGVPASILCDTIALCAWAGIDPFGEEPTPWDDMPVSTVVAFAAGQEQW